MIWEIEKGIPVFSSSGVKERFLGGRGKLESTGPVSKLGMIEAGNLPRGLVPAWAQGRGGSVGGV